MNRLAALLLTAVLLVGSVSALPAAAGTTTLPASPSALQADANAADVAPGQRLAGVIGAGRAEVEGDIERRAYGIEYARATANASKAEVVGERLETVRERLAALEQRKAALDEARENGTMDEGEYRARVTALAARSQQLQQLANASEVRASELPAEVLASKGVDATQIDTLRQRAANLTGPEVAEIARSIAGPGVGRSISGGPPTGLIRPDAPNSGPADANVTTDEARAAVSAAQQQVADAQQALETANRRAGDDASANVTDAIEQAEVELERAQAAIDRAQAALDAGDLGDAYEHAQNALDHAEQAEAHARAGIDAADQRGLGTESGSDY